LNRPIPRPSLSKFRAEAQAEEEAQELQEGTSAPSSIFQLEIPLWAREIIPPRRYKGVYGGRGSGKSHFMVEYLLAECLRLRPTRAVCIREVQKDLRTSVRQLVIDKIHAYHLEDQFEIPIGEGEIKTPGGGHIIFQGMQNHTADSIKSWEGYRIAFCDEAHALSQRSLDLLTPTIRAPRAELWFAWNPQKMTDPVDVMFRENKDDPDFLSVKVNYDQNSLFPEELRRDMERTKRNNPEKYLHVWLGHYQQRSEARVFKNVWVEDFDAPPPGTVFLHGADWGFATDPSVVLRMYELEDSLYIDQEAYALGCRIEHLPFLFAGFEHPKINAINAGAREAAMGQSWADRGRHPGVPTCVDWPLIADSARPETIDFMRRHGFKNIRGALKGRNSVEDGIEFLQDYEAIYIHPTCKRTGDEFLSYAWKIDPKTEEILPLLQESDNHFIDAARYAVESIRRKPPRALMGVYELRM
jgi:phage terminase large subunit